MASEESWYFQVLNLDTQQREITSISYDKEIQAKNAINAYVALYNMIGLEKKFIELYNYDTITKDWRLMERTTIRPLSWN